MWMTMFALTWFVEIDPDFLIRGRELEEARRWDEAGEVYKKAYADLPAGTAAQVRFRIATMVADVAIRGGDRRVALAWLGKAEEFALTERERATISNARGNVALRSGQLQAAEESFRRSLSLVSSGEAAAAALINLASVESQSGRLKDARTHALESVGLWRKELGDRHAQVAGALISLSTIEGLCGDWRGAERSLRESIDIEKSPEAMWNLAVVLDQLGRGREARNLRETMPGDVRPIAPATDWRSFRQDSGQSPRAGLQK